MFKDTNDFIFFAIEKENLNEAIKLIDYCPTHYHMYDLFYDMFVNKIIETTINPDDIPNIRRFYYFLRYIKRTKKIINYPI
jgi:hypothetical protein